MNHTYEPPSLLPAPGTERTHALIIAGVPLLLVLLLAIVPALASDGDDDYYGDSLYGSGGFGGLPSLTHDPTDDETEDDTYDDDTYDGDTYDDGTDGDTYDDDSTAGTDEETADETPTYEETSAEPTDDANGDAVVDPSESPDRTVTRYYDAINASEYATAWELGGKTFHTSFDEFVAGFADTARDDVVIDSVDGDTVTVTLYATQTDGTQKSFHGQYTVTDGVITDGSLTQTG